jgi:diguanylate cyclase (GGDEF)-like protein
VNPKNAHKSPIRSLWAGIAAVCLGIVALADWLSYQDRSRTIEAAGASLQGVASALDQQTVRTLNAVSMLLRVASRDEHARRARLGSPDGTASVVEYLKTEFPHVKTVRILAAETGDVLYDSLSRGGIPQAIEAETLAAHRRNPRLRLHISAPERSAESGNWLVAVSQRFEWAGDIPLLAIAYLDLDELHGLYDEVDPRKNSSVALFRSDALLLARRPYSASSVGKFLPHASMFNGAFQGQATGLYETISIVDGVYRLLAFRRLTEAPLVIGASLPMAQVLAPWRRATFIKASAAGFAIALMLAAGALLTYQMRRRDRAEEQASTKSALLEATLENMDQGLLLIDSQARVPLCNRRSIELLGLPSDLMASRPLFKDIMEWQAQHDEFVRNTGAFRAFIRDGGVHLQHQTYERQRPNGTVLEVRTVPLAGGGAVRTYTDITARRNAERRITHLARHDVLTDLPNRLLFRERMEEAISRMERLSEGFAVLCLDLDQFKAVNDTLGHPIGDALLREVAVRLQAIASEGHTVARLGGDEFAILQVDVRSRSDASALARRTIDLIGRPIEVEGHPIDVGVSIGIALAPEDGRDSDQLHKRADLALYRAKIEGRGHFCFFETGMDASLQARRALERDLRQALAEDQFELRYQPLFDAARCELVGFEALLRWRHPQRGLISPADFVSLAEETRLIIPLGEWILRRACTDAARWPATIKLAVNLSPVQFRGPSMIETLMSTVAATGFSPARIELEITESVLLQDNDATLKMLHQFRALGVSISLDDFGTGYSSLSYLRRFPFDKIKIDRSFVAEMVTNTESAAIVRAIADLGASLGMATTAEGVETSEQLAGVQAAGCTEAQGYYFSPPLTAEDALQLVRPKRAVNAA